MHGFMRIEQKLATGDWSTEHEGEFLFPDEEAVAAASALLAAFADFNKDLAHDALRLAVWSNELPPREREINNAAAVFTLGSIDVTESDGNVWMRAALLLRWGAFKSFSCQDSMNPIAMIMSTVPMPPPFANTLQPTSTRNYWYYPAEGEDTNCDNKARFDAVVEGYYEAWLTLRSGQDSTTWKPGEAYAIGERIKNGSITFMFQELHSRLGEEAKEAVHELLKTRDEAFKAAEDREARERIKTQYQWDVRALYEKYANAR